MIQPPDGTGTDPAARHPYAHAAEVMQPVAVLPGRDTPDPGTPRSRLLAIVAALVLVGTVMVVQQLGAIAGTAAKEQGESVVAPARGDQFTLFTGMMVKFANTMKSLSGGKLDPIHASQFVTSIKESAVTPVEKVRAAIACAEVEGADALEQHLERISPLPEYPGVEEDYAALRTVSKSGASALTQEQRDALVNRHGYFGRLALSFGLPDTDPARRPFVDGGGAIIMFVLGLIALFFVAAIVAIVAFIMACIKIAKRELGPAFQPPMPGGSVFLEVVALMAAMFLAIKIIASIVAYALVPKGQEPPDWLVDASMGAQWIVLLVLFWPLARGMSFAELRRRMGWTSGRGVAREIGAGLFAYFASLPLLFVAMIVTLIAVLIHGAIRSLGGEKLPPPENPVFELVGAGNALTVVLLFVMATVWAPLVEESVFRGALYRHLRSSWGVLASAAVSAVAFGVMHGYMILMLLPVMTLGFVFALMREWRGSLIAPITAHALHNATVLTILITGLAVMRPE